MNYFEHINSAEHSWSVRSTKNAIDYEVLDNEIFNISEDHFNEIDKKSQIKNEKKENDKELLEKGEDSKITLKSRNIKEGGGNPSLPTGSGNSGESGDLSLINSRRILRKIDMNIAQNNTEDDRHKYEEQKN